MHELSHLRIRMPTPLLFFNLNQGLEVVTKLSEETRETLAGISHYIVSQIVEWIELYRPKIFGILHQLEVVVYNLVVQISGKLATFIIIYSSSFDCIQVFQVFFL